MSAHHQAYALRPRSLVAGSSPMRSHTNGRSPLLHVATQQEEVASRPAYMPVRPALRAHQQSPRAILPTMPRPARDGPCAFQPSHRRDCARRPATSRRPPTHAHQAPRRAITPDAAREEEVAASEIRARPDFEVPPRATTTTLARPESRPVPRSTRRPRHTTSAAPMLKQENADWFQEMNTAIECFSKASGVTAMTMARTASA